MKKPKYKLTLDHIETAGNIHKLEHDGFTRHDIHNTLYKEISGSTNRDVEYRRKVIDKLYDRRMK